MKMLNDEKMKSIKDEEEIEKLPPIKKI